MIDIVAKEGGFEAIRFTIIIADGTTPAESVYREMGTCPFCLKPLNLQPGKQHITGFETGPTQFFGPESLLLAGLRLRPLVSIGMFEFRDLSAR
jgi:hypothetical protein